MIRQFDFHIGPISQDLVLKTDLLIGEKLLDEGKQMGLIGKEPPDTCGRSPQGLHCLHFHQAVKYGEVLKPKPCFFGSSGWSEGSPYF